MANIELNYFKQREFSCKCDQCGLGFEHMDAMLLLQINSARERAGVPFVFNSAMRCEKRNKAEGGDENSSHLRGYAVDIATPDNYARFKILGSLIEVGFKRFDVHESFIHVDNDPDKPEEILRLRLY